MFSYFFKKPSNNRDWQTSLLVLPYAEISENQITLHNIRNFKYRAEFDFDIDYYDRTFDLNTLQKVYLGTVRFSATPNMVHILLKFVFENDEIVFSAEVRKLKGQKFIAWRTLFRNYELIYVFGSSSDLVDLREKHRVNEKVNFHLLNLSKQESVQLLKDIADRANTLKDYPEFCNLMTNSCGVNVVKHLNKVSPRRIWFFYPLSILDTFNKWVVQRDKIT
jgi:hypothetical protein